MTEDPTRYFVRENITINGEQVTYTHYYPAFPAGYQFLASTDGKECLAACASRYYSVDPGSGEKACETVCADGFYREDTAVVSGQTYFRCASACDASDYRMIEDGRTFCYTDGCPDSTYLRYTSEKECLTAT